MASTSTASSSRSAYILLTLSSVAFGGTWVTGKLAVGAIPPMLIATSRFAIASVLLWGWTRLRHVPARRLTVRDLPLIPIAAELGFHRAWIYRDLAKRQRRG